jgi:photosystem II stability/assembly factor-like uncharacterized protein
MKNKQAYLQAQLARSVFVIILFLPKVNADWVNIGPDGGLIAAVEISNGAIFAGTGDPGNGVYRSSDRGASWNAINSGLVSAMTMVNAFAESNGYLFAGTDRGVFRSANNGESWTNASKEDFEVYALLASGGNLFVGAKEGVFLSTDTGTTWMRIANCNNAISLALIDTSLFIGTNEGLRLCTKNGKIWIANFSGLSNKPTYALYAINGFLLAGTSEGIFRFGQNGAIWTIVDTCLKETGVFCLRPRGGDLFAGSVVNGIFRSADNGLSWTVLDSTIFYVKSLAIRGDTLVAGTIDGVFLSTNSGATWTTANTGIRNYQISFLADSGNTVFAGTNRNIHRSLDDGAHWAPIVSDHALINATQFTSLIVTGNTLFAGTYNDGVFRSTNDGTSWAAVNSGLPSFAPQATSFAASGSAIFVAVYDMLVSHSSIYRFTDNGTSWIKITGFPDTLAQRMAIPILVSGSAIFAGTDTSFYFSTDNGASWTETDSSLPKTIGHSLVATEGKLFAGTQKGVYLSTNNGSSWTAVNSKNPAYVLLYAASGNNLFASAGDGISLSTDGGISWNSVNSGITNLNITSLKISGNDVFLGTLGGVYRRSLSEMVNVIGQKPRGEAIRQTGLKLNATRSNGSVVAVEFTISHSDQVTIKMFDLGGREMSTFVDKFLSAGSYRYSLDAHSLARGCYAVRLNAGISTCMKLVQIVH